MTSTHHEQDAIHPHSMTNTSDTHTVCAHTVHQKHVHDTTDETAQLFSETRAHAPSIYE